MNAVEYLQPHIDIEKVMAHFKFDSMRAEGDLIRSACKIHDGDNVTGFVANTTNNLYYCHTGDCGGGDVFTLVQRLESCTFKESVIWVANFFKVDINNLDIAEAKSKSDLEIKRWIEAVRSRRIVPHALYPSPVEAKRVTKFREYLPETLSHFNLLHIDEVEVHKRDGAPYVLRNRLAFPIIQNGVQIGISYRRVNPKDFPKWSHQPASIRTKELLYNYDAAIGKMEIAVVEGALDVWAYHEIGVTAVSTFGAHLTEEQYKMLIRTGADLALSYDGDAAGRSITQQAYNRLKRIANVRIVELNDGEDPDNLTREELSERYDRRN